MAGRAKSLKSLSPQSAKILEKPASKIFKTRKPPKILSAKKRKARARRQIFPKIGLRVAMQ